MKRQAPIGFTVKVHILICVKSGTVGTAQCRGEPHAPFRLRPISCVLLSLKSETSRTSQPVSGTSRTLGLKGEPVSIARYHNEITRTSRS
jgi:hypothetical protein